MDPAKPPTTSDRHDPASRRVVPPAPSTIDLHSHTARSDGLLEPLELAMAARTAGVRLLSITDHDTLAGYRELRTIAAGAEGVPGLELLAGVELNAVMGDRPELIESEVHVLGLGVDEGEGDPDASRAALGLGDRPFLHYQGRVDNGKGTTVLAEFFAAYKRRRPGPLALVLSGPVDDRPPEHPDMFVTGLIDPDVMWGLFRASTVYVHPSAYESFSICADGRMGGRPACAGERAVRGHARALRAIRRRPLVRGLRIVRSPPSTGCSPTPRSGPSSARPDAPTSTPTTAGRR